MNVICMDMFFFVFCVELRGNNVEIVLDFFTLHSVCGMSVSPFSFLVKTITIKKD